jgi:magnesium chelatase family protein
MDRIDLHVEVPALPTDALLQASAGESSASMRARCCAARQGKPNQALADLDMDVHDVLDTATAQLLGTAAERLGCSARSLHRTLKVARTIADLAGSVSIELVHAAEAMQYRYTAAAAR